ncbi:MAG: helix-turn-helix domain-containing protein [Prosthecobacter sp.]|jgi:transposase|nr:helix-turn-helix domain-containing protein [Prosthecobacter sp.]
MAALSLDLRKRIVSAYLSGEGTREVIAQRFNVSLGMVKKLLQQRRKLGHIKSLHHRAGRKRTIVAEHRIAIRKLLADKPDMTLAELREALGLTCTLPALHYVLADMNLTFKKRRSGPPSRTGMTSGWPGGTGKNTKED